MQAERRIAPNYGVPRGLRHAHIYRANWSLQFSVARAPHSIVTKSS
jgi:hypothetical protein